MTPRDDPPSAAPPKADRYVAPAIEWVEVLEEAGVYAACAKDPFEPIGPACTAFPRSGGS